jgi:uncharacterized membrane protein
MRMKYVAALEQWWRHLQRPRLFKAKSDSEADTLTFGQRLAEIGAATIGSCTFLGIQAAFLTLWVIVNALRIVGIDPPPFIICYLEQALRLSGYCSLYVDMKGGHCGKRGP